MVRVLTGETFSDKSLVSYHYKNVETGNYLQTYEITDAPVFLQWPREIGAYYILFLLGPDIPTQDRPLYKYGQHWVIANIAGNRVDDADVLVEYAGLTHHYLKGPHRMVFLIFKQNYNFTMEFDLPRLTKNLSGNERLNFSIQNFVDTYYLGRPVAANFFQVYTY
nr:PREDICTED: protein D2-like [Bemisia tabaci]